VWFLSFCFPTVFPTVFLSKLFLTGFYIISIILCNPFVILFSPRTVSSDILLGSILGLLLFNIFVNFITDVSIPFSFKFFIYADNIVLDNKIFSYIWAAFVIVNNDIKRLENRSLPIHCIWILSNFPYLLLTRLCYFVSILFNSFILFLIPY